MGQLSEYSAEEREIITGDTAPKPSKRAQAMAESAIDGEGLGPEVIERIARGMDKAIEEGRQGGLQDTATEARNEAIYLRKYLDDRHQADGAAKVLHRIEKLLEAQNA